MRSRRYAPALGAVVFSMLLGSATAALAQAQAPTPAGQAPMNMANMDHRGVIRGTVRGADKAPVADTAVIAVNAVTGARFEATTNAQGAYSFDALPVGGYNVTVVSSGGLTGFRRQGVQVAENQPAQLDIVLDAASAQQAADAERQDLLAQVSELKQRVTDLESNTVLSEPETRVRKVEKYVDANGQEHDEPVPGAKPVVTYERERVYRRQTISEKIEEALADAEEHNVKIGIDAAITAQFAKRTKGDESLLDNRAYALASADIFFTAGIAQNTIFFADIVALSGSTPDNELNPLTLLNGYTARLSEQNALNLREVWLRTELFGQRLALTMGRLDLTNYFDANAFSNDESTQFLSDALVNNQMLGLSSNGTGVAAEFDPKNGFRLKFGLQQSNDDASNLSDSLFTLSEVGYTFTPFALPEGTYRAWFRTDNTADDDTLTAAGISFDQKLTNAVGLFARYGSQQLPFDVDGRDHYWSAGVSFQNGFIFNPQDTWGVGYSEMRPFSRDREKLIEGYYNLLLTERLRLSFHLAHVLERPADSDEFGYLLPGVRLQAAF